MPTQGSLGIEPMCRLAGVSRAGFYRFLQQRHPGEEDMEVRNAIHEIVLEHRRRYGYRRVAVELRRRGMAVNHKRVLRLMREDNLLGIEPRAFIATTESDHDLEVCLNLASRMNLNAINQLWVADITYIRLRQEWCWMCSRAKWSDGRWTATSPPAWRWGPCNAPSPCANPLPAWCTTPIAASSTPPGSTRACSTSMASCPA